MKPSKSILKEKRRILATARWTPNVIALAALFVSGLSWCDLREFWLMTEQVSSAKVEVSGLEVDNINGCLSVIHAVITNRGQTEAEDVVLTSSVSANDKSQDDKPQVWVATIGNIAPGSSRLVVPEKICLVTKELIEPLYLTYYGSVRYRIGLNGVMKKSSWCYETFLRPDGKLGKVDVCTKHKAR